MPKRIKIEAKTKSGDEGSVLVDCPTSLEEAKEMFGELEVFKGFLRDRVIIWQRDARPVATNGDAPEKPKKRLSVFDRLNAS
jgi:hypothetical protein